MTITNQELQAMDVVCVFEPDGYFRAYDMNTYDCDFDCDGFYCVSPTGAGRTPLDAIVDLLDNMEDKR